MRKTAFYTTYCGSLAVQVYNAWVSIPPPKGANCRVTFALFEDDIIT